MQSMQSIPIAASPFEDWLGEGPTAAAVATLTVLGSAVALFFLVKQLILPIAARVARSTRIRWDDFIIDPRFRRWSALLITLLAVRAAEPLVPGLNGFWTEFWLRSSAGLAVGAGALAIVRLLIGINQAWEANPLSRERPIKGYLQVVQIVVITFCDIWVLAILTDQTPWYLLSGLGAALAVFLVLFHESIMSLAASMQLAQNDMVRVGDWIEMPDYGANGTVIDIALATVKVRNWDNTITTVPTHRLTAESFKNWRGMAEAGARRIAFPIQLDISSVKFLDGAQAEAAVVSNENDCSPMTNVEALRQHVTTYLQNHPGIDSDTHLVMVHQQPPTPLGLPLEVYVFCCETGWEDYEAIKGDIISYCLAMLPRFGLRAFQHPSDSAMRAQDGGMPASNSNGVQSSIGAVDAAAFSPTATG